MSTSYKFPVSVCWLMVAAMVANWLRRIKFDRCLARSLTGIFPAVSGFRDSEVGFS